MKVHTVGSVQAEPVRRPVRQPVSGTPRRGPVRRLGTGPVPAGPGRAARPVSRRSLTARRGAVGPRPVPSRPVAGRPARASARSFAPAGVLGRPGGWRAVGVALLVALGSAVVVFALGALADGVRAARVPAVTAPVTVHADESLWQVARRSAPSAEPAEVVARIIELNGLDSSSVRPGQVVVSPIG